MTIEDDATTLLITMADYGKEPNDPAKGHYVFDALELQSMTEIEPHRLNDAVNVLEEGGLVKARRYAGMQPFQFGKLELTSRGRLEAERVQGARTTQKSVGPEVSGEESVSHSPLPVGSPYGFTDQDWEAVSLDRDDGGRLVVAFGYQWNSEHYDADVLLKNIEKMFAEALDAVGHRLPNPRTRLDFRALRAGYGGHLFNQIARDIIGSDITVFDTSDMNPNVMIEMGVALTWGVRVLPIRSAKAPETPSDISGQTWAIYNVAGASWEDSEHAKKLEKMIELALRRKPVAASPAARGRAKETHGRDPIDSVRGELEAALHTAELERQLWDKRRPVQASGFFDFLETLQQRLLLVHSRVPRKSKFSTVLSEEIKKIEDLKSKFPGSRNMIQDAAFLQVLMETDAVFKRLNVLVAEMEESAA
jgi:hypothetical protein